MKTKGRQTPEACKESLRKYRQSEKGKACQARWSKTEKGKLANVKKTLKYRKTEKGREAHLKSENKRKRTLGFIKLFPNPFSKNIKIHWHHITDNYVIALPANIHIMCICNNRETHRENCWRYVEQFYI